MARPPAGAVVAWWDGSDLALAVSGGEEKQRVRLVLPGGQETRVPAARIAFVVEPGGPPPGKGLDECRAAGRRAATLAEHVRRMAAEVDVATAYDLSRESEGVLDDVALAELALGSATGIHRAAVVRALLDDGVRFVRRGVGWEPRAPDAVAEILRQRERASVRAAEEAAALAGFAAAERGEHWSPTGTEPERRYLAALEELAVRDLDAPEASRSLALQAIAAAGTRFDRPAEGAFRLLRRLGRFVSDDENLSIVRFGLRVGFPPDVLRAASEAAARGPCGEGRADLTALEMVTVDSPATLEIDDALSAEPAPGGGVTVGVHIADPCAFVLPGDPVDREALARTATYYLPDVRIPMIPPAISEEAASLVEGEVRPALSFLATISEEGEIRDHRIVRSLVRSRARLDYESADRAIASGDGPFAQVLRRLAAAAGDRERARVAAGALRLEAPEVDVRVLPDGRIVLERVEPGSAARRLVAEAMVLAGILAARFCSERGLPAVYRRQAPPDRPLPIPAGGASGLVAARAARRSLRRGEVSAEPGQHFALGVPSYAQATSPIRRYQDLATHRQIAAALAGLPPVYDAEVMRRIAATTERAEADGRLAERASDRYWLLRYLEAFQGKPVEAVVVETAPRTVVVLLETLLEEAMPAIGAAEVGDRVTLVVERVNPRADLVRLSPGPCSSQRR